MPKNHSDYPINVVFRASIRQRDFLNDVAEMHGITSSDYLRALLDAALVAEAKSVIGVPGADEATAVARAREVIHKSEKGASHA